MMQKKFLQERAKNKVSISAKLLHQQMQHEEVELSPEMEEQKKPLKNELRRGEMMMEKKPSTKQQRMKKVLPAAKFLHRPMRREEIEVSPETKKQMKL